MSDVTVAPPSAAPSPSSSSQTPQSSPNLSEVVVNQSPQSSPNPIGSQAPEKPANWNGPEGRKEAIQRAFDRASNPQAKAKEPPRPASKPAEAKAGHNQPPEETPKLNLKKRPEAQDEAQATPRGERGRFAPRQA